MAPLKTYGAKKRDLLTLKDKRKITKPQQNARRPLATLQSTNVVRPGKKLVKCKTSQKTISLEAIAVRDRNVSTSSPSFPGSEELSSIWNCDSTFDKLLQANEKPVPVQKDVVKKISPLRDTIIKSNLSKISEKPAKYTPPSRSKKYKLRPLLKGNGEKFLHLLSHECLGCGRELSNSSKSCSRKTSQQTTSTPNINGNTTNAKFMEFTPIYPETVKPYDEMAPILHVGHTSLMDTPKGLCGQLPQPEWTLERSLLEAKSPKTRMTYKDECCSPDMFSPEISLRLPLAGKKFVRLSLKAPQPRIRSSESLPPCDENTNNCGGDMSLRTSDNLVEVINSGEKPITELHCNGKYSIQKLGTEPPNLPLSKILGSDLPSTSIGVSLSSSIKISRDSKKHSNELECIAAVTVNDTFESDCMSKKKVGSFDSNDNSLHDSQTHSSELMLNTSVTASDSVESDCLSEKDVSTLDSVNDSHLESLESVHPSSVTNDGILATSNSNRGSLISKSSDTDSDDASSMEQDVGPSDSLDNVSSLEARLSSIASESDHPSYLATDEENASPILNYVNLRTRKVRWNDQSSLKNHSRRLEQKSLCKVAEDISAEEDLKTATVFGIATEVEPAPTVRPSVASSRRTSMWQSSRSRAASRRFSVAPGKLLAKPRQDSLGFRGLHGIPAPPTSELDDFYSKLGGAIENLSTVSIAATENIPLDVSFTITARDVVLQKCDQKEPIPFEDVFPETYLSKCRKIGEGLYGEVFMWTEEGRSSVLKIIPIAGDELINGERQKTFDEILSEIVITKELSDLRHAGHEGSSEDLTSGFVEVKRTACVRGRYPPQLLRLWQEFADESGTENENPELFADSQLFIVLDLAHGGADLEKFVFNNSSQALSIFLQTAYALAAAERRIEFEHRDLHWGNVLVSKTDLKHFELVLNGTASKVATHGVQVSIIDFTLSRMTYDGCCIYNDLSQDDSLFVSEGDYQFDVYRLMKANCRNDWQEFVPANNILWLHYIVDKMISGVRYRRTTSKVHRLNLKILGSFKHTLLDFESTVDFVESLSYCH